MLQPFCLFFVLGDGLLQGLSGVPQLLFILHAILLQPVSLVLEFLDLPVELVKFLVGAVD